MMLFLKDTGGIMNKILTTISVGVVFFLSLVSANAGSLTVYTAIEAED